MEEATFGEKVKHIEVCNVFADCTGTNVQAKDNVKDNAKNNDTIPCFCVVT